jgi:hypothetical protein
MIIIERIYVLIVISAKSENFGITQRRKTRGARTAPREIKIRRVI